MCEMASTYVRYGYWRWTVLLRREGWKVNAKRIYRLYSEEQLIVRTKQRRKMARHLSTKLCLRRHSYGSLKTGLEHGIELVKHGTDGPARSFPSALLQRGDSQAKLQL